MNKFLVPICFSVLLFFHFIKSFALFFVPRRFRKRNDISGQTVLITGAGSGIGRELAIQFSKNSTCLVLLDINHESLLETKNLVEHQSTVFTYWCDVSDRKMVYEVAEKIKKEAGDVDILVNNAGIVVGKCFLDLPDEKIVKTMEVNALAHFWTCKAFLPAMMAKNKGHIVSIASIVGKTGGPMMTDYSASKFAAVGFAESLELELLEKKLDGIKVTIVCPTYIDTGLFEGAALSMISFMSPEYVAKEIVAGVLEEAEVIYLPHILKYIFMIRGFFPRWLINWYYDKTGTLRTMENFTGRTETPKTPNSVTGIGV